MTTLRPAGFGREGYLCPCGLTTYTWTAVEVQPYGGKPPPCKHCGKTYLDASP